MERHLQMDDHRLEDSTETHTAQLIRKPVGSSLNKQ